MIKLSTLLGAGPALNRIAKSFKHCFDNIALYNLTHDPDYLLKSAWIYTYGIQKSFDKWSFNPITVKIYIPDYQHLGRISINEAMMILISNITKLSKEAEVSDIIDDITDEGVSFENYSYLVSTDLKDKLKP